MPNYLITDNQTGKKFKVTGDSPPTEAEAAQIFKDMGAKPQVTPEKFSKELAASPKYREQMADFIRKEAPRNMKQEAVRGLPLGNRFADATMGTYNNPVYPERTVDAVLGPQTQSQTTGGAMLRGLSNLATNPAPQIEGAITFPADFATGAYKAATSPESGSLTKFGKETVKGIAAPTGLSDIASGDMSFSEARAAWEQNALGSGLTAYGATRGGLSLKDLGSAAIEKTAPILSKSANKLTDMTLKQSTTLNPKVRDANVKTALEGDYQPTSKGVDKLNRSISEAENKIQIGIETGKNIGVKGNISKAIQNIEQLRKDANISSDPVANNALIDAEIAKLKNNPLTDSQGDINISNMQKMKVAQGREIAKSYGEQKPQFMNAIDKARVRGFKEELETKLDVAFPELAATNKQLGEFYNLKKSLERAANRIENNQGIGIGGPIKAGSGAAMGGMIGGPAGATVGAGIGTLIGIIEHPAVAPKLAQALYKAQKGAITRGEARKMANRRIADIKLSLILSNQKKEKQGD